MTERATSASVDFGIKGETMKNIQKNIKAGMVGKAKLISMKNLLSRNSEQLKQKIEECFQRQRKLLNERETKLLNKVNVFVDSKISEIEDKLQHYQENLDYLYRYQHCIETTELAADDLTIENFNYFVAASRYDFCEKKDGMQSSFKKFGALKEIDVLVARFDSSEDESDDDIDMCTDNTFCDAQLKRYTPVNKGVETESSDIASSCSVLSYKEIEEENEEKTKMGKNEYMDDDEFLTFDIPSEPLYAGPVLQVDPPLLTDLHGNENTKIVNIFEREKTIEKMLEVFKNTKANANDISTTEQSKVDETTRNVESNLAKKAIDSVKRCESVNENNASEKELCKLMDCLLSTSKMTLDSMWELKPFHSKPVETTKTTDHISNFNSRVEMILDSSSLQNSIL